jgi:arabinogalactan endo-1,4-beta-galactosidase
MRRILLTLALTALTLCAPAQLLYKISGRGLTSPSYIVGTYHLAPVSFVDSIPGIRQAMADTQQTYGELLMDQMFGPDSLAMAQQAMMLPDSMTLDNLLTTDEMDRLNAYMKGLLGMDMTNPLLAQQMKKMTPSALSHTLTLLSFMKKSGRFDPKNGFDEYFQKEAVRQGKNVGGLETMAFQAKTLYKGMTLERQKELLMCLVDHADFMSEMEDGVVRAYFAQDINAMKEAMDTKLNNSCDSRPEEEDMILYNRNADWLTKMPAIMASKPTLFAVGAGHLPGERGVLNLLRQAGYTVEGVTAATFFVKGADVSGLPRQESRGVTFRDREGHERECLELLKNDYGLNAIRLRVWVEPTRDGSSTKEDVLAMALRAKALGMDVMIDFHYSDWWADPGQQPIPRLWLGHSYEQMKEDLRLHTIDVLIHLKKNGVEPRWVQVGNETSNGLLWTVKTDEHGWPVKDANGHTTIIHSMGHIKTEPEQYAGFIRTGYDAVKEVLPNATVIVHLDNGYNPDLYDYNLGTLLQHGAKFDMVGMSLYPYWAKRSHPELEADTVISRCMANIRRVSEKYGCNVMIVETGFEVDMAHPEKMEEGRQQLGRIIREARDSTNGRCRGVFYWEPQTLPGGYKLGAFGSKGEPTAIMEGFLE